MVDMTNLLNLQVTIFCLMLAGYVLTKTKILTMDSRKHLANLLVNFVLPCNILVSFMTEFSRKILIDCLAIFFVSLCIQVIVVFTCKYFYPKATKRQLPVLQYGTMVSNAGYMGNPIAQGLYGDLGLLYASVYLIPLRIVMWSVGVTCFTGSNGKGVLKKAMLHPCILAVFFGMFLMVTGIRFPAGIDQTIRYAGNANTALSMIIIGNILAEVKPAEILDPRAFWFCTVRLLLIPIIVFAACQLLNIDEMVKQVSVVLAGMPAAATTAILASTYEGDEHFAAKIIFLSTLFSMLSVPLLCLLMNL